MPLLSSPLSELEPRYDAIVIGSGYGGAIAAATLARTHRDGVPLSVALLERGEEIPTGRFPDEVGDALRQLQIDHRAFGKKGDNGLFYFHIDDDITLLQGCGLGGTSLINANVSLKPEDRVMQDPAWPRAIRTDEDGLLSAAFQRACDVLRPIPYPDDDQHRPLMKYRALTRSAQAMNATVFHPPINVTFETGLNPSGVEQHACTGCGDCVVGCNVGAKNTLTKNYLPEARADGARLFCGVDVRWLERTADGWLVRWQPSGVGREEFDAPPLVLAAGLVVLAAGSLGSTEILLRSREKGLSCSARLGERFTGNGDFLAFGYNCDIRINAVGIGEKAGEGSGDVPGPTITGAIDLRDQPNLDAGMIIEEGALPSTLSGMLPAALATLATVVGKDTDEGVLDEARERLRGLRSLAGGADTGAVQNTQTYLVMAHDDANGRMRLDEDRVRIDWPDVGEQKVFESIRSKLEEATAALGGTMVPSPLYNRLLDYGLVTVHPLGGCPMADAADAGVVNDRGQVFSGTSGSDAHAELYVLDGAVIPRPLGVNPLLTISALAERGAHLIARDRGWTTQERPPQRQRVEHDGTPDPSQRRQLWFTERLTGHMSLDPAAIAGSHEDAEEAGRRAGSTCALTVTIRSPDIEYFLQDPMQEAEAIGTVEIPSLDPRPLTVTKGRFNLLVSDPNSPREKQMRYLLPLVTAGGRQLFFEGHKVVKDDKGFDPVTDTTVLLVTLHEGDDETGPVVGRGIVRISPADFARQLTTLSTRDAEGGKSTRDLLSFGRLFVRGLWETYGPGGPG